ncbi:MAG: UDP-N-acetylmuramoyl-L-alanyl-D-glutamate--2,6-diaminopimelate ligase [Elusimicrobia bacterium]|nr:UDP-N-acetylmuramoyl-L-alanyl-D-glutamate--2,6-diaminopimelate ligase [Elusimicrobiota bacterium]
MKLSEILKKNGLPGVNIKGLCFDSRLAKKGDLFFAVKGSRTDGNAHIGEAAKKGAVAIVTETPVRENFGLPAVRVKDIHTAMAVCAKNFYKNPSSKLKLIGVSGTHGKTTVTYLLEKIFCAVKKKPGVLGTINYRLGGKIISKAPNTTPMSPVLNEFLSRMVKEKSGPAIMEVSSHSLCQKRVEGLEFDSAIFTNLERDHLDYHKTLENYFAAKLLLFNMLSQSPKHNKTAVINGDDARSTQIIKTLNKSVRPVLFGLGEKNPWRATDIKSSLDKTSFRLLSPSGNCNVKLNLCGEYNVYNALAAIACANAFGADIKLAARAVGTLKNIPGRMERIRLGQDFHVFVDFAHTDGSLKKVLRGLEKFPHNKLYIVFGCGGNRDRTKRGPMGVAACSKSHHVFITTDNPRREDPKQIFRDIERGIKKAGYLNYTVIADRKEAVYTAIKSAKKGDIVILAGKGHENYQLLGNSVISYSDYETAEQAIKNL